MAVEKSPMMQQYRGIKNELSPDTVLFFRLGDFYEMFNDDAKITSEILGIALTKRNKTPMCGLPYHQLNPYLHKMIRAGQKVAICEQVEDPAQTKGIVKREVTRVVTPGTILEEDVLEASQNNFLAGITKVKESYGVAMLDLSTGEFWIEECERADDVRQTLLRFAPAECIVPEEWGEDASVESVTQHTGSVIFTPREDWTFEPDVAQDVLVRQFQVKSLSGFGCEGCDAGIGAAGAVLYYVSHDLRREVGHISRLRRQNTADFMLLDETTIANLDLVPGPGRTGPNLLQVLSRCQTAMGSRLLRSWLIRPLTDLAALQARHGAIADLLENRHGLMDLRETLKAVKDLERLIARIGSRGGNARDVKTLGLSLGRIPEVKLRLQPFGAPFLRELDVCLEALPELVELIETAIHEEPSSTLREGRMIRDGFHSELDTLREAEEKGEQWLKEFREKEAERTGIQNLKVRYNKVFGYYIEITKSNLANVPEAYERKQTLVNAERFVTPELKEYENKILGAKEKAQVLERQLFAEVRQQVVEQTHRVQQVAERVAAVDVLAALADGAAAYNYVRPDVHDGTELVIKDGRHPIVESMSESERFVPNDTTLDTRTNQLLIITGPNMAGKSTYIRQVAIVAIMAQMGSFVPASEARIGLVDRVFTRVGASDDLARGRSTFMVEMQETANILHNATSRSLIVLDEIGRGTSTFDGISIAWAVAEHLHNQPEVKARTLFATHYHELTDLALTMPGVKNYSVLVKESGDHIVFLRKIVPGSADKSYGIQVARLAGLPTPVIHRAREILANLEADEFAESGEPKLAEHRPRKNKSDDDQLSLFGGE